MAEPSRAAPAPPAAPRFALAWAALVYAVCTLSLAHPALRGLFLISPISDQYLGGYPVRDFAATMLKETGHFPLWNPYLLGGMPYVAAMHGDIFYPTFLLRLLLPTDVGMTWGFIIHLFLAGLFSYTFLRAIGLSFYAALVGGVAYMLGGNIAGLVAPGHDGKLFLSALLPLTLLLVVRLIRDGKLWACGALAFVVGLGVLTPHPQLLQYLLLTAGAFGVFLAFADTGQGPLPRSASIRRLALAAGAVIVGMLIGAVQFLPVVEYVAWSPRAGGKPWEAATSYSLPPEETINFALPQFSGILDNYWGRNGIHFHSDYIGITVLILAGLALSRHISQGARRLVWFWSAVFVVSLFWAFGGYTPFYRLIYAIVPGTKFFRAPSTMLFVVAFSVSVLAAFGAERALRGDVTKRYLMICLIAAAALALLGISGGLTNLGVSLATGNRADQVYANQHALSIGAFRSFVFAAFAVTTLYLIQARRLSRDMRGVILAAVVAVDLWSIVRMYWLFSDPGPKLYATNAAVDYMKNQKQPWRVLAIQIDPAAAYHDPYILGDGLMVHHVRNVLGYHGNELGTYQRLGDAADGWRSVANPNFWRLMNVKFILTNTQDLSALGITADRKVVGPVKDAAGTELTLFELAEENPLAWVAPVIVKANEQSVLATVLDPRFDVRRAALFDTSAAVKGEDVKQLPPATDIAVRALSYAPGAISLELDKPAPAGSALLVSENYYPGWKATVDGKDTPVGRADVSLIGIPLSAGARRVDLKFTSPVYDRGAAITLAAIALSLAAWIGGYLVRRKVSV